MNGGMPSAPTSPHAPWNLAEEPPDEFQTHLLGGAGLCSGLIGAELHVGGSRVAWLRREAGRGGLDVTDPASASPSLTASFKFLGGRGWG